MSANNYETHIRNIVRVLLGAARPFTLMAIAELIGMSKRSVQNYLGRIEEWIDSNGLAETSLVKRQGSGIALVSSPADRKKIERLLLGSRLNVFSDDFKRRTNIIRLLLLSGENLTIQKLASIHYTSRIEAVHDLEWAGQWFARHGLKLYKTQRRGIGLAGTELAHRNAIAAYFDLFDTGDHSSQIKQTGGKSRLTKNDLEILTEYCPLEKICTIEKIISTTEKKFDFLMMGDYYVSLVTHLVICISRVTGGNPVSADFAPPSEEFPQLEVKTAEYIAKQLEAEFNIRLDEREKAYVCIHLMGYNAFSQDKGEISVPADVEKLTEALVEKMETLLEGNYFSRDVMLFLGLSLHLKAAVFRLGNGIYLKKRSSASLADAGLAFHDAATEAAALYKEFCGVTPDDEELNSLAQYFLLSSRRNRHPKKALLACDLGIAERIELLNEVEARMGGAVVIVNCCTALQVPYQPDYEYDFIITTENLLDRFDKPVVCLAGVSRMNYVKTISEFIETSFN